MADAADSKSAGGNIVRVQVPPSAFSNALFSGGGSSLPEAKAFNSAFKKHSNIVFV